MKREMCSFECSLVPTLWTKKYLPSSVTTTKRFLILKWIFERRLIVTDGSFENWVISLGWYSRISPSFSCGIFDHMPRLDPSRTLKHIWWIVNIYIYIYIYINEVLHSSCHINLVFCYASEFFPKIQTQLRSDFFLCDNFFRLAEIPQSCALTSTLCLKHQSIEVNVLSSCYFRNVWLVWNKTTISIFKNCF